MCNVRKRDENHSKCTATFGFISYSLQLEKNQKCFSSVLCPRSIKLQLKSSSSNKHYGPSSVMCFIDMHKQNMLLLTHML